LISRRTSEQTVPEAGWPALPGYEILGELARGGMGIVYKARQLRLNRLVAIKMILTGPLAGPAELTRFQREAEAVACLQHPNIVQIFEVGEHHGRPFLALEHVAGGSLDRRLAGTPQPPAVAAALVEMLARAVHAAHQAGIVHRDLKPANVLLAGAAGGNATEGVPDGAADTPARDRGTAREEGTARRPFPEDLIPKITDFGLAKRLDVDSGQTPSHAVLGTPSYMAPEQALGRPQQVGTAADVYALGAILYECLTGRPPFKAATPYDTLIQVVAADPVPPRQLQPGVPLDLDTVCLQCLAKEPAQRYPTAVALAEDLQRFLQDRPVLARPAGSLVRLGKFVRRNQALSGAVLAVFLALVLGIAGTTAGLVRARADRTRALNAESAARADRDQASADRDRAQAAERDAQQRLAQSHYQAARLAMQRGAWRAALTQLDAALAAGHPDEMALRFDKVRAWYAVHEVRRASRELEALARRPDLGDLEGQVLLWRGDIAWDHHADDRAIDLIRQATHKKLPVADRAYAHGLLAKTSPDAVRDFHAALAADPFHRKANAMVAALLLLMGQLDESGERITFGERLFPEDPTFKALRAAWLALQGDRKGADALLGQLGKQVSGRQVVTARAIVEMFHYVHQMNRVLDGTSSTSMEWLILKMAPAYAKLALLQRIIGQERGSDTADFLLPIPPVFVTTVRPLKNLSLWSLVWGNHDQLIKTLDCILPMNPDALLHYLRGLLLLKKDRWAEAERDFTAVATTSSIANVRKLALFAAIACQWKLAHQSGRTDQARLKARALESTRQLVSRGVSRDTAPYLIVVALGTGEVGLAHEIVASWERLAPRDPAVQHKRMEVEFAWGAYGRVLETAARVLKRFPREPVALKYQGLARAHIRAQERALGPAD
jgi:serine/threonine protein kinase